MATSATGAVNYAPASKTVNGSSLLHYCVMFSENNVCLMKQCLDKGVDVNLVNSNGETALSLAAAQGNAQVVDFLIKQGANIGEVFATSMNLFLFDFVESISPDRRIIFRYLKCLRLLNDIIMKRNFIDDSKTVSRNGG